MQSSLLLLLILIDFLIHSQGNKNHLCSQYDLHGAVMKCRCNHKDEVFIVNADGTGIFKSAKDIIISDCTSAYLHIATFEQGFHLRNLTLQRIQEMQLDALLPPTLKTLMIEDIDYIHSIEKQILFTKPNLAEFILRNSVVNFTDTDIFDDISSERIVFENVTFHNLEYSGSSIESDKFIGNVKFIKCHFKKPIPSYALRFKTTHYEIKNCVFDGLLKKDAIIARAEQVVLHNNTFASLGEHSTLLQHYNNEKSLRLSIVNNIIQFTEKDAVDFGQNSFRDISLLQGNTVPCNIGIQCDDKVQWLLGAIKHISKNEANKQLLCKMLKENHCIDVKANTNISMLEAMSVPKNCKHMDITFVEEVFDVCREALEEFEHKGSGTLVKVLNLWFMLFLILWVL